MGAMLLRLEGAAGAASEEVQGIIELGSLVLDPMKAVGLAQNMGQAIAHWDQTMAAIQRQVDDTANTYWESRLGLINPEDAYRKEGAFFFHVASNLTGGWVVKGAGKTVAKLAGKVDDVGSLAGKTLRRWSPIDGPGPLGNEVAATFRGATYTESLTSEATTLYRSWGGSADEFGSYWTRSAPTGPLQTQIDSALLPQWGNNAQNVTQIRVPPGTTIYEGFAAPQGGLVGGGNQVYLPR